MLRSDVGAPRFGAADRAISATNRIPAPAILRVQNFGALFAYS